MNIYLALLKIRSRIVNIMVERHGKKQTDYFNKNYISRPTNRKSKTKYVIPSDYSKLYASMKK